jgi:sugar (pentulose or hexulose) kinase
MMVGELRLVTSALEDFINVFGTPDAIMISGQMGSWILTDDTGRKFTELISWQDTSYSQIEDDVYLCVFGNQYSQKEKNLGGNGGESWLGAPWRGFAVECKKFTPDRKYLFHTLTSWVSWELTGRINHVIHFTDAAASGMCDIQTSDWFHLSTELNLVMEMPKIIQKVGQIGQLSGTTIPVYVAVGDQQASLLGAGLAFNRAVLNAGTGGQVAKLLPNLQPTPNKLRPYFNGQYIETITHIPSGRFIEKFLALTNQFYGINLGWEWIWERWDYRNTAKLSRITDWEYDNFLDEFFKDKLSPEEAKNVFLADLLGNFSNALTKLDLTDIAVILLAGGVAQKLQAISSDILGGFGISVKTLTTAETTLNGLAKLSAPEIRNQRE